MADNPSSVELAYKRTSSNIIIGDLLVAIVAAKYLVVSVATLKKWLMGRSLCLQIFLMQ